MSSLNLKWFGHSGVSFSSPQGLKIVIDPWLECPTAPKGIHEKIVSEGLDLILVTHGHSDHIGSTVALAKETGAKVVAIYEVMLFLGSEGVPQEQLIGMNKGGTFICKDTRITMVKAEHSSGIDHNGKVLPGGEPGGFIVRFENNFCLYHTGDTCLFAGIEELITERYHPDLLLLPIGDLFTMGPEEAAIFVDKVKPKKIIPLHWGTFPILTGTPQALQQYVKEEYKEKIVFIEPGESVLKV